MQQGGLRRPDGRPRGEAQPGRVIQMARAPHVQQQMAAGKVDTVLTFEVVVGDPVFIGGANRHGLRLNDRHGRVLRII